MKVHNGVYRYDDLVAQGISLRQISMSSSLSNISQTSSDLAPDTPRKPPTQPPSPSSSRAGETAQRDRAPAPKPDKNELFHEHGNATDENVSSNLQKPLGETVIEMQSFASEQRAEVRDSQLASKSTDDSGQQSHGNGVADHRAQNGIPDRLLQATNASEIDPLLAASPSRVLSDHPVQSADSTLQGMMLHDQHEADDAAEQLGMTPSALKVGIRSAVVAMNLSEGPSENATEALEAFNAAGNSPKTLAAAADAPEALDTAGKADAKGRIMKASSPPVSASVAAVFTMWQPLNYCRLS